MRGENLGEFEKCKRMGMNGGMYGKNQNAREQFYRIGDQR